MLEIIFSTRNKAYGAYQLRTAYPNYLLRAFLLTLLMVGGLSLLPRFSSMVAAMLPERPIVENWPVMTEVDITPPPVTPPTLAPPPPPRNTIRFVPPLITDNETRDPEPPSTMDELLKNDTEIGQKTINTGTYDEPPAFPDGSDLDLVEPVGASGGTGNEVLEGFSVQKMPSFPGGDAALMAYLREHLEYPALARENNIKGTVALQFVVDEKGQIRDIKILKDPGGGCAKEAVRIVTTMPPWIPGEANGHPVRVRFTLPIRFNLL